MQSEQQFEQLILQYTQLKNGAEDIARLLDEEDYNNAITLINTREPIFLNCKCIRKFLELTPTQKEELDKLLDELKTLELKNIKTLEYNMDKVRIEMRKTQGNQKMRKAYGIAQNITGEIVNFNE